MANEEGFPEWVLDDSDNAMEGLRAAAEWLYHHQTTPENRVLIRGRADIQRKMLEEAGIHPADPDIGDGMWQLWLCDSSNWQTFLIQDCEHIDHMKLHAIRALQWSSMILLLTTEPYTPEPLEAKG